MNHPPFVAPAWRKNRHVMTISATVLRVPPTLALRRERWELPDGDFLDLDFTDFRDGPTPDTPLLLCCHGLEGSSRAGYVLEALAQARAHGLAGAALNFRSCSEEENRLPRLYHSGETSDLAHVIDRLSAARPDRPLGLLGFSLGGNVVAKYLGERGDAVPAAVRAAAVVSVPFDLAGCSVSIDGPGLFALVYRERFLRKLRPKALRKLQRFPGLFDGNRVRRARLLRDFDDLVTAPLHGFRDAADYYARSSSGPLLPAVRRPLLVLSAEDDPFVPGALLPRQHLQQNPHITALLTPHGGHVGFASGPPWAARYFAEERAAAFLARHLRG